MFTDLNVFKLAHAMAVHAGRRQAVIAQNVANADTPGYRARDIPTFLDSFRDTVASGAMRASRDRHLHALQGHQAKAFATRLPESSDPNGNSVSVELEMLKSVEVKRQHDRALAIYKSSLNILRSSLGRS